MVVFGWRIELSILKLGNADLMPIAAEKKNIGDVIEVDKVEDDLAFELEPIPSVHAHPIKRDRHRGGNKFDSVRVFDPNEPIKKILQLRTTQH